MTQEVNLIAEPHEARFNQGVNMKSDTTRKPETFTDEQKRDISNIVVSSLNRYEQNKKTDEEYREKIEDANAKAANHLCDSSISVTLHWVCIFLIGLTLLLLCFTLNKVCRLQDDVHKVQDNTAWEYRPNSTIYLPNKDGGYTIFSPSSGESYYIK